MTDDVAKVAAGLSAAQRVMFCEAEQYGVFYLIRWPGERRPNGWRNRDPLCLYWNPQYDSLTRRGLALRQYLLEQETKP